MARKGAAEPLVAKSVKEPPYVPIGLFDSTSMRRVTSPTGDIVPAHRPISRATATLRGLDLGARDAATGQRVTPVPIDRIVEPRHDSPERRRARGITPIHIALKASAKAATPVSASQVALWASDASEVVSSRLHSRSQSRASVVRSVSRAASRGAGILTPGLDLTGTEPHSVPPLPASGGDPKELHPTSKPRKHSSSELPCLVETDLSNMSALAVMAAAERSAAGSPSAARVTSPCVTSKTPSTSSSPQPSHALPRMGPAAAAVPQVPYVAPRALRDYYLCSENCETFLPLPWTAVCIPNDCCQDVTTRAAVLCAATLDLKQRLDKGQQIILPRSEMPIQPEHVAHFGDALNGTLVVADDKGSAAQRFVESSRHIVVAFGQQFFEVPIMDSAGRYLVASELKHIFDAITCEEASTIKGIRRIPIGKASRFPRGSLHTLQHQMKAACLVNGRTLATVTKALFAVVLADASMKSPSHGPILGFDGVETTAQWIPSAMTVIIYPDGDTVMRASALFCTASNLIPCAAWIANAAATDPMLLPPTVAPQIVQSIARGSTVSPRPVTPAVAGPAVSTPAGNKPRGKAAPPSPLKDEAPVAPTIVTVTVPPPTVETVPRRAPVWMPEDFKLSPKMVVGGRNNESSVPLHTFEVTAQSTAELQLAILLTCDRLALGTRFAGADDDAVLDDEGRSGLLPNMYSMDILEPCQTAIRLCRDERIDNAIAHLAELKEGGHKVGPLPADVGAACKIACASLDAIHRAPAFVSLAPRGTALPAPTVVVTAPPPSALLAWAIETTRWPPTVPLVSFQPLTTDHSSLRRRLGTLFQITVVGTNFATEDDGVISAVELATQIKASALFIASIHESKRRQQR